MRGKTKGILQISCQRCGACCQVDFSAYVTEEDLRRWQAEGRRDILQVLEAESPVWAGDRLVSAADGQILQPCTFLVQNQGIAECAIYATRPRVCREFAPGSSPLCPKFEA